MPILPAPRIAACASAAVLAASLSACASAVSTSSFKGEEHAAAQSIADLQSDATAGDEGKICRNDLAAPVVGRLGGAKGCEAAIKDQLAEVDSLEVNVTSVKIASGGASASATIKSTYSGKSRSTSLSLLREGSRWKVAALP